MRATNIDITKAMPATMREVKREVERAVFTIRVPGFARCAAGR
jgi:hypothetical protein